MNGADMFIVVRSYFLIDIKQFQLITDKFRLKLPVSCGITGLESSALPMIIHWKLPCFLKVSPELHNEERCGYVHCTCQMVSDRLMPVLPIFGSQKFHRKQCSSCGINGF
ncbi:hypothetical protein T10_347 [Trichinella papuae]|uniref:Uncharacterized protein n=1 Tax=Trichinella papuae TaxID=268474 RepID=A0A0V1MGH5_9BILA|nr:hypothetical protein T10_347 [Trichinella papuae]